MLCGRGSLVRVGIKLRQRRRQCRCRCRGRGALRVPRGNKNWFAHSFVSIGVVRTHTHTATPTAQQSLSSSSSSSSLTCFSCHFYLSSQGNQFTMCLFVSRLLFLLRQTERRTDRRTDDRRDRQTDRPVNSLAPFLGFGYYDNPTRPSHSLRTSLFATFLAIFKHFCSYACFTSYLFDCPTGGRAAVGRGGVAAGNCQVACAFMFAQQKQPRPNARPVFLQQSHVCLTHK